MKSITIHNLEDPLDTLIRQKAKNDGLSLNKTIKKLLAEALNVPERPEEERREDFRDLFGIWTESDVREFQRRHRDLEKVDPADWR